MFKYFPVMVIVLLLLSACQGRPGVMRKPSPPVDFFPPVVVCRAQPDSVVKIYGNQIVTIKVIAENQDNSVLTYNWSAGQNVKINGSGPQVTVDTTDLAPGSYPVTVTVHNVHGYNVPCTSNILVGERNTYCSHVTAYADPKTVEAGANSKITLHVLGPDLPDNPYIYEWKTDRGVITGSGETVTLDLSGLSPGPVNIRVTGRNKGCVGSDSITVTVVQPFFDVIPIPLSGCNSYKGENDTRPEHL